MRYGIALTVAKILPDHTDTQAGDFGAMYALSARKKQARSAGYGFAVYGASQYGVAKFNGGIYRRATRGYNQYTGPPGRGARQYHVLCRTYRPTNPQTVLQQAQRAKMIDAVSEWQGLTTEQKENYNRKASRNGRTGYNFFISGYLKNH